MKNLFFYTSAILLITFVAVSCKTKEQMKTPINTMHTSALTTMNQGEMNIDLKEFRLQGYEEINKNEKKIDLLITNILRAGKTLDNLRGRRLLFLKKVNNDLKGRLISYNLNSRDWDKFKTNFNSDIEDVATVFTDLYSVN